MKLVFLFLVLVLNGCTSLKKPKSYSKYYELRDTHGTFQILREVNTKHSFSQTLTNLEKNKIEESLVVDNLNFTYQLWIENIPHVNYGKWNPETKNLSLKIFKEKKQISEVNQTVQDSPLSPVCFFFSLPECLSKLNSSLFSLKLPKEFFLIVEGYPFFSQLYPSFPNKAVVKGTLFFDKYLSQEYIQLRLQIDHTHIFYVLSKQGELKAMFWPEEGVIMADEDFSYTTLERELLEGLE